jgi:antitoxin ParD1/3/4
MLRREKDQGIGMSTKAIQRNIRLTPHFDDLVRRKVASGRYESASAVVHEGLRLLEERDRDVRQMKQEIELGWQQTERGEVHDGAAVFAEIRALSKACRNKAAAATR